MLSPEQIAARKHKLTASRVACLMTGDEQAIYQLWLELTDSPEFVPENLWTVWAVRLCDATEALNLEWYARKTNGQLTRRGEMVVHPSHPWAACTLDGWDPFLACPVETKHVGGREPLEVVIDRYQPQVQWQMFCTEAVQCALSIIVGASEPIVEYVERDDFYILEMEHRAFQFMEHVWNKTPPVILPAVPLPTMADKAYDMTGNNLWASQANLWITTKEAAQSAKDAEKVLKSLVPADGRRAHGHGVQITRDRAGRLSLRELK